MKKICAAALLLAASPANAQYVTFFGLQALYSDSSLGPVANVVHGATGSGDAAHCLAFIDVGQGSTGVYELGAAACAGGGGGGAVNQVTNSDGTLTISPTTGNVVASLALAHANTWTAATNFNLNAAALPTPLSGTILQLGGIDAANGRVAIETFAGTSFFSGRRAEGTAALPAATAANSLITNINALGYTGSAYTTAGAASVRLYSANLWTPSSTGAYIDIYTTPTGSTTVAPIVRFENDGGVTVPPTVTGGDKGAGTVNATALYQAGVALGSNAFTSTAYAPAASPTITGTMTLPDSATWTSSGLSALTMTGGITTNLTGGGTLCLHVNNVGLISAAAADCNTGGITTLTGDVTATGTGSVATTLATVNGNAGSFGGASTVPSFTVNAKGLITAASSTAVIAPAGTLSGATLAAGVTGSSLTSVGTLASLTMGGTLTGQDSGTWTSSGLAALQGLGLVSGSKLSWNSDTYIERNAAGDIRFGDVDSATPVAQIDRVQSATGTNIAGPARKFIAALATGSGASGAIEFDTGPTGTTGTTQATATAAVIINTPAGTSTLPTLAFPNAGTNCGFYSSAANKFDFACNGVAKVFDYNDTTAATVSFGASVFISTGSLQINAGGSVFFTGRGSVTSPALGKVQLGLTDTASPTQQTLTMQSVIAGTSNGSPSAGTVQGPLSTGTGSADLVLSTTNNTAGTAVQNTATAVLTLKGSSHVPVFNASFTVAGLPTGVQGMKTFVTDQLTTCAAIGTAPTGGGAVFCPVYYNGSIWVGG